MSIVVCFPCFRLIRCAVRTYLISRSRPTSYASVPLCPQRTVRAFAVSDPEPGHDAAVDGVSLAPHEIEDVGRHAIHFLFSAQSRADLAAPRLEILEDVQGRTPLRARPEVHHAVLAGAERDEEIFRGGGQQLPRSQAINDEQRHGKSTHACPEGRTSSGADLHPRRLLKRSDCFRIEANSTN